MQYKANSKGQRHDVSVSHGPDGWKVRVDDREFSADVLQVGPSLYSLLIEGRSYEVDVLRLDDGLIVLVNGQPFRVELGPGHLDDAVAPGTREEGRIITAPMPGRVVKLLVKVGDPVQPGDGLVVLEAMKMENELRAARGARVGEIRVKENQAVSGGEILVVLQ